MDVLVRNKKKYFFTTDNQTIAEVESSIVALQNYYFF
jgi:hypothetical protein